MQGPVPVGLAPDPSCPGSAGLPAESKARITQPWTDGTQCFLADPTPIIASFFPRLPRAPTVVNHTGGKGKGSSCRQAVLRLGQAGPDHPRSCPLLAPTPSSFQVPAPSARHCVSVLLVTAGTLPALSGLQSPLCLTYSMQPGPALGGTRGIFLQGPPGVVGEPGVPGDAGMKVS